MTHKEHAEKVWKDARFAWEGKTGWECHTPEAIAIIAAALEARYRAGVEAMARSTIGEIVDGGGLLCEKDIEHIAARLLEPKPNAETRQALEDVAAGKVTTYDNVESFFKAIEEE